MELVLSTNLEKMSLIYNLPVEFSYNGRRTIQFRLPTVRDLYSSLDFKQFLGLMAITPDKIKGQDMPFITDSAGSIIQGLLNLGAYKTTISKYLLKIILNSVLKDDGIYVDNEKVLSYELEYIAKIILIAAGAQELKESDLASYENKEKPMDPIMAKIAEQQRLAEEKLKKSKAKKNQNKANSVQLEEILLSITYEFHMDYNSLLDLTYYAIVWLFGFVGKVDSHKMNQLIMSSGMSKQKTYNYWLK